MQAPLPRGDSDRAKGEEAPEGRKSPYGQENSEQKVMMKPEGRGIFLTLRVFKYNIDAGGKKMKKYFLILVSSFLLLTQFICMAKPLTFLLLISEQNIEGPQRCWWASEIDLSTIEAKLSEALILKGYSVLAPYQLTGVLHKEKAFRQTNLSDEESIKLAKLTQADYVILGKAVASSGANVPDSNMRSCNAFATVKLIRVRDGQIIAYLDSAGSSVHPDVISGGREALLKAGEDLAIKVIDVLNKSR